MAEALIDGLESKFLDSGLAGSKPGKSASSPYGEDATGLRSRSHIPYRSASTPGLICGCRISITQRQPC
jgi:hypothetical protein